MLAGLPCLTSAPYGLEFDLKCTFTNNVLPSALMKKYKTLIEAVSLQIDTGTL